MRVDELFDVEICKNPVSKEYVNENFGSTAYITTTSENNGVDGYTSYPPQYQGNVLTVSKDGASADAFYQSEPFCGNEKVMVLIPKLELSPIQMVFYAYAISFNKERFAYGRKCSVERLSELNIPNVEDIPKWVSTFKIKPLTTKNKKGQALELKVNEWKEFIVGKIFQTSTTSLSIKDELERGSIPLISRTSMHNGCDGYFDVSKEKITKGHCITVGAEGIYAFYQPENFATGNKVYTLRNEHLTKYNALFITTILNTEIYKYSYGRARILSKLDNEIIKLPALLKDNKTYEPDWEFMENYMKSIPYGDRI